MAIAATCVWEVRTTGTQNGGSLFKPGATGTDYSQQDAPQYDITDASAAGAGLTITTAAAAADMVGNGLCTVGGTHVTANRWFEITSVVVGTSITVAGAANIVSDVGHGDIHVHIGGAFAFGGTNDDQFTESSTPGNMIYVQSGEYTGVNAITTAADGTTAKPITYIGYITSRTTIPTGTDRPLINMGANAISIGDCVIFKYVRFTGTASTLFNNSWMSTVYQCSFEDTSGTANQKAFNFAIGAVSASGMAEECEFTSTNGIAVNMAYTGHLVHCYIHDSVTGVLTGGTNCFSASIVGCVIDKCTTAIDLNYNSGSVVNNTLYSGTTGIDMSASAYGWLIANNIISDFATGATCASSILANVLTNNCWNNTTDIVNLPDDDNGVFDDPLLKAPETHDFTLQNASPCIDAGSSMSTLVGTVGSYAKNIGAQMAIGGTGGIKIPRGMRGGMN